MFSEVAAGVGLWAQLTLVELEGFQHDPIHSPTTIRQSEPDVERP